jgi:signal transduction histidine kinase/ligand-binding sensor domain-containing protein
VKRVPECHCALARLGGLTLLALALTSPGWSAGESTSLHFQRVGSESGPPSEVITAIYQDNDGFVWIGARDGLFLYDGHAFNVFEHDASDPTSISDHSVRTIYEDRRGNLWIGTNSGGLDRLDRATWEFEHFRHDSADPRSISHNSVYAIFEDHTGNLWVGTQIGLNRMDRETGTFERLMANPGDPESISHDYIMVIYEDLEERTWVGTLGGGLNLWNPRTDSFTSFQHNPDDSRTLSDSSVSSITEDTEGRLWIGTVGGLNLMDTDNGTFRRFGTDDGMSDPLVTSIAPGPPGILWVGTHGGGLNELDVATGTFRIARHEPDRRTSIGADIIMRLLTDDAGTLWVGTWGGGLLQLTRTSLFFTRFAGRVRMPADVGLPDVSSLLHDRQGGVWLGTRTGYVMRKDPYSDAFRPYLVGGREGNAQIVLGLEEDRDGNIWIGSNAGVTRLDPRTGETVEWRHDPNDPASLGPGYVRTILEDRLGRLWVGTGEGGVQRIDREGRVLQRFVNDPADPASLSDDYITALFEDDLGRLWVGTRSGGLNSIDPDSEVAVRYVPVPGDEHSLSYHYVTSITQDSRGRLWIGTGGGGLNRVETSDGGSLRFVRFTEKDGLIDNDVMGVLEDNDGSLWISTKRGLSRFETESGIVANFYVADGLPAAEFESGSAARTLDRLCFGSVKGLVAFPAGTSFPAPTASPTVVASIRTSSGPVRGDRPAWSLEELVVPYGEWLSFELAVLDYSPEHRHRYAYRLGPQTDWIDLGSRREITFTGLKPGIHELAARGRNNLGVWSMAEPVLRIRVVPPFWMTTWFRAVVTLAIVALAIVIHQVRMSALERRNRELMELHRQRERAQNELARAYDRLRRLTRRLEAAKEDERQHIARELHDDMGPALTAVIINLQLLSRSPDPETAAKRIDDTVELVDRMVQRIRDLSLDLRPPLLDELGLIPALKGYLEAQAERAGIDIEVDADSAGKGLPAEVAITAFRIVQEAVTNVIRHSKASRASINVRRTDAGLDILVEDDGCGFDVAEAVDRATSGKAIGLLGMQERVRMLDGEIDISSVPGKGTRVSVRMPLEIAA